MIKANELRIGNSVELLGSYEQVYEINEVRAKFKSGNGCNEGPMKGIPLTPEILENFGFDIFYESGWQKKYTNKNFDRLTVVYKANRIFTLLANSYIKDIQFVHQLQNLYFALTGEELNVNL